MTDLPHPQPDGSPADAPQAGEPRWELVQPPVPVAPPSRGGRSRRTLLAVGGAAILVLAIVAGVTAAGAPGLSSTTPGAGTALAAVDPTATPTPQVSSQCQSFLNDLAQRLGVSTTALQNAVSGARQDMIDQAVKDGRLTQSQAAALKSRLSSAPGPACFGLPGLGVFGPGRLRPQGPEGGPAGPVVRALNPSALLDAAAAALKIDSATLLSEIRALQPGQDLRTIAQQHGVAYSTLTAAIDAAAKQQLDAAVANGTLTSSQETSILSALDTQLANGKLPFGFGFRGPMGGGFPGIRGPWQGGQHPAATPAPATLPGA